MKTNNIKIKGQLMYYGMVKLFLYFAIELSLLLKVPNVPVKFIFYANWLFYMPTFKKA